MANIADYGDADDDDLVFHAVCVFDTDIGADDDEENENGKKQYRHHHHHQIRETRNGSLCHLVAASDGISFVQFNTVFAGATIYIGPLKRPSHHRTNSTPKKRQKS